jgi:hypothetical protein
LILYFGRGGFFVRLNSDPITRGKSTWCGEIVGVWYDHTILVGAPLLHVVRAVVILLHQLAPPLDSQVCGFFGWKTFTTRSEHTTPVKRITFLSLTFLFYF